MCPMAGNSKMKTYASRLSGARAKATLTCFHETTGCGIARFPMPSPPPMSLNVWIAWPLMPPNPPSSYSTTPASIPRKPFGPVCSHGNNATCSSTTCRLIRLTTTSLNDGDDESRTDNIANARTKVSDHQAP